MELLTKKIKIILLFTFIGISTFGQNYELNKNVFYNDITNLYVHEGKPFSGKLTNLGIGYPSDRLGRIKKKVIEIKNGKVDGLLYSINEFGDTLNKFTLINNSINGYFSFTFQESEIYNITGFSINDTLSGKIKKLKFNFKNRKWEISEEGVYSKSGGHPIDDFKSYIDGQLIRIIKPFSDHIGLFYLDKKRLNKFINDVNFNFGSNSMLNGFPVNEGVSYISSPGWSDKVNEYLFKNGNFIGFLKYSTGGKMVSGRFDNKFYKTFYYFNGKYENGFNIKNFTKNQFVELMNLFEKNHVEYTYSYDKNSLLHRKNYINGKLDGQFIEFDLGSLYKKEKLRTFFIEGIEIGPRIDRNDYNSYYSIDKIVNGEFDGTLRIYEKSNPYQPYITCNYVNGVINTPIIKYHNNWIKNIELVKISQEYFLNEYFTDGSLKISIKLKENEFKVKSDEIMGRYSEIHKTDYTPDFKKIEKILY